MASRLVFTELESRIEGEIELVQFGLMPEFIGQGLGKHLLQWTIDKAWSYRPRRFWLHTCTLDHPNALGFYQRTGFAPYERKVEVYDDPRSLGITRRDAAPRVPLL